MTVKQVRFGVIGGGLVGREFGSAIGRWCHLLDQKVAPVLTAVCDINPAAREWFTGHFSSVKISTAEADEVLASRDVDAVYIAVPHNLHADLYIRAIEAGKNLLGEKPFGIDLAACERIVSAASAHPNVLVRCSSEFPFYPGAQRIIQLIRDRRFGTIIEVESGFLHSSDLDPNKPINWKRRTATCGEYGALGDLGLHTMHVPLRSGWMPYSVHAVMSKIVPERPDGKGGMAPCETWDNARLTCRVKSSEGEFPLVVRTERVSPGETDTWYLTVRGTKMSAAFTTKYPRTFRYMEYTPGEEQSWRSVDIGYQSAAPAITGHIFEFGFPDAILQMWAAFLGELNDGAGSVPFGCLTPQEALQSHRLFTAALESHRSRAEVSLAPSPISLSPKGGRSSADPVRP